MVSIKKSKATGKPSPKTLIQRAKVEGTPLIDGDQATFVWESKPGKNKNEKIPYLVGDFNGWGWDSAREAKLTEAAKGVWTYTLTLPRNAYLEYLYTTDHTDPTARMNDPLSKKRITNGFGKFNNHFSMPEAVHTRLTTVKKDIPQGKVTQHQLEHEFLLISSKRDVWLYAPPVNHPVPLVLVYDGKDYLRRAKLPQIIDNLIDQGKIEPVGLALVENAGKARFTEYNASEACLALIIQLVLPLAQRHLNLIDVESQPGAYGVIGASMGGLMALYTGVRLPSIFGKIISQSGSFQFDFMKHETVLKVLLRTLPTQPLMIWQDVGLFEWLLNTNRQAQALLQERGYNVTYREYAGAHNFTCWCDQLPEALIATFGKNSPDR
ncbi:MAG TPA: alpha/beta hydrolase-fold protein [Phototrophicaceae bacterium]|nr:alpha/beta hydrolase-fold protein [Phototrophicaceae bacterium]